MISYDALRALGIEWVEPSSDGRRPGYYRRIPMTRNDPTPAQAQHRLRFSQVAYNTYGTRGTDETLDRRQIPANAAVIGDELRGTGSPKPELSVKEKLLLLILKS